jgi:hypothetical protein
MALPPPDRSEAAEYYFRYIDLVPAGNVLDWLESQSRQAVTFFGGIRDATSQHRYEPGKWSIREVLGHVSDTERLFVARAFWFARGFDTPLPSFDQDRAIATAGFDTRPWDSLVEEFTIVRAATLSFYRGLPADAWDRRGVASGNPFTVRALAFIVAGHLMHHQTILQERYLGAAR